MELKREYLKVYGITDRGCLKNGTLSEQVEKALKGGVSMIQFREKVLEGEAYIEEAKKIRRLCAEYQVPFIINDSVEMAQKIGADGVHVGQKDMNAQMARKQMGRDKIIGVTARTLEQAIRAQEDGADYLGVGAVFHTASKKDAVDLDWEVLKEICATVDIPVVAIGGITTDNVSLLKGIGIDGVAVISGIFGQEDVEDAAGKMKELVNDIVDKERQ